MAGTKQFAGVWPTTIGAGSTPFDGNVYVTEHAGVFTGNAFDFDAGALQFANAQVFKLLTVTVEGVRANGRVVGLVSVGNTLYEATLTGSKTEHVATVQLSVVPCDQNAPYNPTGAPAIFDSGPMAQISTGLALVSD